MMDCCALINVDHVCVAQGCIRAVWKFVVCLEHGLQVQPYGETQG